MVFIKSNYLTPKGNLQKKFFSIFKVDTREQQKFSREKQNSDLWCFFTDVPSSPEDISVHDIFQDSCVLKWKKPKDDGGMPIVNYIIERQDLSVKGCFYARVLSLPIHPTHHLLDTLKKCRWMASSWWTAVGSVIVLQVRRVDQQKRVQISCCGCKQNG